MLSTTEKKSVIIDFRFDSKSENYIRSINKNNIKIMNIQKENNELLRKIINHLANNRLS